MPVWLYNKSMKQAADEEKLDFIGREYEIKWLKKLAVEQRASIVVIYGRRRVGKTALLEHVFSKRNVLKIEGVEGL